MGEDREKNSYVYEFDELNRMEKIYRGDGKWAEYSYDGTSARVGKRTGTVSSEETETTKYYNMGATVLNEVSSNDGNTTNLIGAGIEARMSVTGSSITSAYFLQKNAHGDVTAAISGTERAATYDYDAFGNTLVEEGEINNPIRYSGEYLDEETGLIYLRARYYDPSVGRFISEDPIRDGMNWYAYCGNSPVMFADPSGLIRGPGYNSSGEWSENPDADDFGYGSAKYNMLESLGNIWRNVDDATKIAIEDIANNLRAAHVDNITRIILLNDENGAIYQGHMAVLLINEDDTAFLFSYYPTSEGPETITGVRGEMRFRVLGREEWNDLLYEGRESYLLSTEGDIVKESYTRNLYIEVDDSQGSDAFITAVNYFREPGTYYLFGQNCDEVAQNILESAGIYYDKHVRPNDSFEATERYHTGG